METTRCAFCASTLLISRPVYMMKDRPFCSIRCRYAAASHRQYVCVKKEPLVKNYYKPN